MDMHMESDESQKRHYQVLDQPINYHTKEYYLFL